MNQTSAANNDLQKAIEDITKSTNMDPVFADPVAAPAAPAPAPAKVPTPPPAPITPPPVISDITVGPISAPTMPAPVVASTTIEAITPAPAAPAEPAMPPVEEVVAETTEVIAEPIAPTDEAPADMKEVKQAALRDLAPLLDKLDVKPEQKFDLYKNVINDLGDTSVVSPAYQAATGITDDRERGEALLYLINTIDNM